MASLDRLTRFYGLPLPKAILDARDESLTDQKTADLFDAHLGRNYGYFGALDKTLSGFVVLDNRGDDAWLYDARDTKAVFFHDHDERGFHPRLATLGDYRAFRAELGRALDSDDDEAPEAVRKRWFTKVLPASKRVLSTAALGKRLQWAVWFFGQPMRRLPAEAERHAEEIAPRRLPAEAEIPKLFERERPHFKDDPHLAISWLLLTTVLADPERFAATAGEGPRLPLFRAFVKKLSALGSTGTLEVLPAFRRRRARLLSARGLTLQHPEAARSMLLEGLAFDVEDRPLGQILMFVGTALEQERTLGEIRARLQALPASFARDFGELVIHFREGSADPKLAGRVVKKLTALPRSTDPEGRHRFEAFSMAGPMLADPALRLRAARHFLVEEPLYLKLLSIAAEAAAALGDPEAAALSAKRDALEEIRPLYVACQKGDGNQARAALNKVARLPAAAKELFLRQVLSSPETFEDAAVEGCLILAVRTSFAGRGALLARGLGMLSSFEVKGVVQRMRRVSPEPEAQLVADLGEVLSVREPRAEGDFAAQMRREELVKAVSAWLSAGQGPEAIEGLLARLEGGDPPRRARRSSSRRSTRATGRPMRCPASAVPRPCAPPGCWWPWWPRESRRTARARSSFAWQTTSCIASSTSGPRPSWWSSCAP